MHVKLGCIFLLVSIVYSDRLLAEDNRPVRDRSVSVYFKAHNGAMIPHYALMAELNHDPIRSFELGAWFGNMTWQQNRPILGTGYFFSNLGNREVYGTIHAAFMSMLSPMLNENLPVQLKIGLGVAYATKIFDNDNNPYNRALGSNLNAYGQISFTGSVPLVEDKWWLRPGVSFHHFSNGTMVAPNQGINLLTIHLGVDFKTGYNHSGTLIPDRIIASKGDKRFSMMVAPGIKQIDSRSKQQIYTSTLFLDAGYMFYSNWSIGVGAGIYYNETWAYQPYSDLGKDDSLSPFQSALHITLQKDFGPLSFILHPGHYIYKPSEDTPGYTNRLGFKYSFKSNLTLQFSIKHHWFALADYFEWGIGYQIFR